MIESPETPKDFMFLQGVVASRGIAIGPAIKIVDDQLNYPRYSSSNPSEEFHRLQAALEQAREIIASLKEKIMTECSEAEAQVLDAHLMILEDEALLEKANVKILDCSNAESAWMDAIAYYAEMISRLADETLAARAADIQDVGRRVLQQLLGDQGCPTFCLDRPSILIARDLTPSQTAGLDKSLILGLCTAEGGPTSHTAILAKALNIPALVGLGDSILEIPSKTLLILDALKGELVVRPDNELLERAQKQTEDYARNVEEEYALCHQPSATREGRRVEVVANIGSEEDALTGIKNGAEGVGLLRTEFIYLKRNEPPSEEEQMNIYSKILEVMGGLPVVVRTLDIGGDKEVPYLGIAQEKNPFLGFRAIRYCLDNPNLFRSQLRALLRASSGYDLRIMFPMIATIDELRAATRHFKEVRQELKEAGVNMAEHIQLGIMVEIPSVAVLADQFAREVDFFSIGTNDLTQYTLAADRCNEKVACLGDPCHPAVLHLIRGVVDAAHQAGIWVGVCGELGSDPEGIPILLGLGLDEISVAPGIIPHVKRIIRSWNYKDAQRVAETVLNLESAKQVRECVKNMRNLFVSN